MNEQELEKLLSSVTPELLQALALTAWGTFRHRGRIVVPVAALLEGLTAGIDTGHGAAKREAMRRLRDAILATIQHMPDAAHLEGT